MLATFGATFATFLTVREMRAVRVQGARARITSLVHAATADFSYTLQPGLPRIDSPEVSLVARNASTGVGQAVHVDWSIANILTLDKLTQINQRILNYGELRVGEGGFAVEYVDEHGAMCWRLPVSSSGTMFVGDLGPAQELSISLPVTLLNVIAVSWLALVPKLAAFDKIARDEVPAATLIFRHSSPYEQNVRDSHTLRFDVSAVYPTDIAEADPASPDPRDWTYLRLRISPEFTSREIDELPQVVIA